MQDGTTLLRACLSIAFLALLWTIHISYLPHSVDEGDRYAVYFDAGSSGTRIHVFAYRSPSPHHKPSYIDLILPDVSKSIEPGLSHYVSDPSLAGQSLLPLLAFAYDHVPESQWRSTPVRLLATAGLRLVSEMDRNSILDSCRSSLASSHFAFRHNWALVIPGEMEGLYAWAGANYASGALEAQLGHKSFDKPRSSLPEPYQGVLELGGASFQVNASLISSSCSSPWMPCSNHSLLSIPGNFSPRRQGRDSTSS